MASLVPFYEYDEDRFFVSDAAPEEVAERRRAGFRRLADCLGQRAPETIRLSDELAAWVSDLQFTSRYRVPFQYARYVQRHLKVGMLVREAALA